MLFTRIVVGLDGSPTAAKAVDTAINLAVTHGAELHLVSAYTPPPKAELDAARAEAPDDIAWRINGQAEVDEVLAGAASHADVAGLKAERHSSTEDPASAILDVAEEIDADLIVVGNKGMSGARRFLLGSVPNKISHHAPCSVLIVHTTG